MKIAGKTFLITGGASGLGAATAQMVVDRGGSAVLADVSGQGESTAAALGAKAVFVRTDVTQEEDGLRAVTAAQERFGALHVLVNCAGVAPSEKLVGRNGPHQLESFTRAVSINLIGTFNMMRLAAAAMMRNAPDAEGERGVIVNTASIAAFEGQIGQTAYAASKAGVVGLTLPAARELARSGIRVVAIAPGIFMTPMMAGFSQEVQDSLAQSVPFPPRLGRPEEFASMVASVCEQTMLNGEVIRLDGALRMGPK
ncbi:MAG TPA: SDR family NAD(P)-dependent oxidoreductase [Acidobacteriaceae bacterium]|nr:SDR family NAD(P)-dependent oxidoreductase [Acidobacteriaceae bacterium]